jgi:hypothetical protein
MMCLTNTDVSADPGGESLDLLPVQMLRTITY